MATRRSTFSKTQRERDKRAKAEAKRERRASQAQEPPEPAEPEQPVEDQQPVLDALAALHERYADGQLSLEDFEKHRDELRQRLHIS